MVDLRLKRKKKGKIKKDTNVNLRHLKQILNIYIVVYFPKS